MNTAISAKLAITFGFRSLTASAAGPATLKLSFTNTVEPGPADWAGRFVTDANLKFEFF